MKNKKTQLIVDCEHNTAIMLLDTALKIAIIMLTIIAYMRNIIDYIPLTFLITYWSTFLLRYLCETHIYQLNGDLYLKYSFSNEPPIKIDVEKCLKKRTEHLLTWEIDGESYTTNIPETMK